MPGEALPCSDCPRNRLGFAVTLNGLVDNHSHLCVLVDREGHGVSLEALLDDRLTAALLGAVPRQDVRTSLVGSPFTFL